jgi:hypothetical protein
MNQSAIKGEQGTGFEKRGDKGAFECGNCRYFSGGLCRQEDMVQKSREPRRDGLVEVDKEDCCEFIERVGKRPKLMELLKNQTYNEAKGGK